MSAVRATAKQFPEYQTALLNMIAHHDERRIEPLLLALYYQVDSNPEDVYLFEVVQQYGYDEVGPEGDFIAAEYASTPGLPLPSDHYLYFSVTNPTECRFAIEHDWPTMQQVRHAVKSGQYRVLYKEGVGEELFNLIVQK